jgi:hypothetical protein
VVLIKVLFTTLLLLITLDARENPFFPSDGEKDMPLTSNEDKTLPPLKRAAISFPPQARVLQKVTIEYKTLDGSVESKSIELQNSIDWHLPIFISQSYAENSNEQKSSSAEKEFEKIASIKYASFYTSDKELKIITTDKILRNFLLVEPHRIVIDFKRDTSLKSYTKENKKNVFTKIRIGNHAGYYRAVIELDGLYTYTMEKISDGYILKLK